MPPFHLERANPTGRFLLAGGETVLGMAHKPRVVDPLHRRQDLQPARQSQRIIRMGLHAQLQCLQTFEEYPGIERAHGGAAGTQHSIDLLADRVSGANHCASQAAALPVEVLGGGVDDDIRPQGEWQLQCRRAETVVHHQQTAVFMRQVGQRPDIGHFGERIGGCLQKQQSGLRPYCSFPCLRFPGRRVAGRYAKA